MVKESPNERVVFGSFLSSTSLKLQAVVTEDYTSGYATLQKRMYSKVNAPEFLNTLGLSGYVPLIF